LVSEAEKHAGLADERGVIEELALLLFLQVVVETTDDPAAYLTRLEDRTGLVEKRLVW